MCTIIVGDVHVNYIDELSTLKHQISQRYRNNRRRTPATNTHKISLLINARESANAVAPKNGEAEE